jgi:dTDP-glucose 4,6-dehydratase
MEVIVTGAYGFIGSHFVNKLKELNPDCKVTIIDKLTYAANIENIKCDVNFIHEDIWDIKYLPDCDYIVHFAAETHVDNSIKDGRPFVRTNVEGTFNLVELAKNLKRLKKFIHVSTDEVYGDRLINRKMILATEESNLHGSSYYSSSKIGSDMIVEAAGKTFGLPYIITRTCNNFGENQHPEKMLPKIIQCVKNGETISVYGDGEQVREWIHADDNSVAIYNLLMSDVTNEVFNIGSGYRITNNQLIAKVGEVIGKIPKYKYVTDRLGHDKMYGLHCEKYIEKFGPIKTIELEEWLKKILK